MRLGPLLILVCLGCAVPAQAQVYKSVDKDGVVRYSDQPPSNPRDAKPADLKPLTTVQAIASPTESGASAEESGDEVRMDKAAAASGGPYAVFRFQRPQPDETMSNIGTLLSVYLDLTPQLQDGHKILVSYDGQDFEARATTVTLTNVFRGTHSVSARIVDEGGATVASTGPVSFHVQQHSILKKILGTGR